MKSAPKPRLRPIEIIVVRDATVGRAVMLRDTEGVTSQVATIPLPLWPIVSRFDGTHALAEIAEAAARDTGADQPLGVVGAPVASRGSFTRIRRCARRGLGLASAHEDK